MGDPQIFALDTSVCIEHMRDSDPEVSDTLEAAEILYLPLTAFGELVFGYECSGQSSRELGQMQGIRRMAELLIPDVYTAECYGKLKRHVSRKGKMIPEGDLWIAATAQSHGLKLYCKDAHFEEVADVMDIIFA